jgi:hypothetical protein
MLEIENLVRTGKPQKAGELEITPQTSVLNIRLRGHHAGLTWNRPRAVIVKSPDGQETILPVRDVTRLIIWGMLAGGFLGAIIIGLIYRDNKVR